MLREILGWICVILLLVLMTAIVATGGGILDPAYWAIVFH